MDRLDKFIATHSEATRTLAKMAIKSGRVTLNGVVASDPGKKVSEKDSVVVNGLEILNRGEVYIAVYKPDGVVCSHLDETNETIIEMIDGFTHKEMHIAGRLDKDTTGLVLMTSDGKWAHRVTSPKRECEKVYLLETADPIDEEYVAVFERGLLLRGEERPTLPAKLEILGEREARLVLTEGRYHQVKRMFGAMGNKVVALHRESVGAIGLRDLEPGEFYELNADEVGLF